MPRKVAAQCRSRWLRKATGPTPGVALPSALASTSKHLESRAGGKEGGRQGVPWGWWLHHLLSVQLTTTFPGNAESSSPHLGCKAGLSSPMPHCCASELEFHLDKYRKGGESRTCLEGFGDPGGGGVGVRAVSS